MKTKTDDELAKEEAERKRLQYQGSKLDSGKVLLVGIPAAIVLIALYFIFNWPPG